MKMLDYELDKSGEWIKGIVTTLSSSLPEDQAEVLTEFLTGMYPQAMDIRLMAIHGEEQLLSGYDTEIMSSTRADLAVTTYLIEKIRYIKACMGYIAAEYNPIENYASIEHETGETDRAARRFQDSNIYGSRSDSSSIGSQTISLQVGAQSSSMSYGARSDSSSIGSQTITLAHGAQSTTSIEGADGGYTITQHIAKVKETDTIGTREHIETVSPYDDDNWHNKVKTTDSMPSGQHDEKTTERVATGGDGGDDQETHSSKKDTLNTASYTDTTTNGARSDSSTVGAHTDNSTAGARSDSQTIGARSDSSTIGGHTDTLTHTEDALKDSYKRDLERSGNIGVQTAAQMMAFDSDFWKSFSWLSDMCRDIVNLTCEGMVVI